MQRLRLVVVLLLYVFLQAGNSTMAQTNGVKWVWAKAPTSGSPSSTIVSHDVKADNQGNQYVTGYFTGTVDFGNGQSVTSITTGGFPPSKDAFVVKYDQSGAVVWLQTFGSNNDDEGTGIDINRVTNEAFVSGYIGGVSVISAASTVSGASITRTPQGNTEAFAVKVNATGKIAWFSTIGGSDADAANDLAIDDVTGDAFITGYATATMNEILVRVSGVATDQIVFTNPGGVNDYSSYTNKNREVLVARLSSSSGAFLWSNTLGLANVNDWGNGIAIYKQTPVQRKIYIAGATNGNGLAQSGLPAYRVLQGGTVPFVSQVGTAITPNFLFGGADAMVVAINDNGTWVQDQGVIAGGPKDDAARSVGLDRLENIFVTGTFKDRAVFGRGGVINQTTEGIFNTSDDNIFIANYLPTPDLNNGNFNQFGWVARAGNSFDDAGTDLVVTQQSDLESGTVYLSGWFRSSPGTFYPAKGPNNNSPAINAGAAPLSLDNTGGTNARDGYVAKYGPTGNLYWLRDIVCDGDDEFPAICMNGKDEVFITVNYGEGPATLDLFDYPSLPSNKIILAQIKDRVAPSWQGANKPANGAFSNDIYVDKNDYIYVTGRYNNTVNFAVNGLAGAADAANPAIRTSNGNSDYFVAKYDKDQKLVWLRTAGGTVNDEGYSLVVDNSGNVYVVGYFQGNNVAFGPNPWQAFSSSPSFTDGFVSKYDANGNLVGYVKLNATGNDQIRDIALDKSGTYAYVTGYYTSLGGGADLPRFENTPTVVLPITGAWTNSAAGARSFFAAKLSAGTGIAPSTLSFLWASPFADPSFGDCQGNGIAVSSNNNVYIASTFVYDPANPYQSAILWKYDESGGSPLWRSINGPYTNAGGFGANSVSNNNAQGISVAVYGDVQEEVFFVGNFIDDESAGSTTQFRDGIPMTSGSVTVETAPYRIAEAIPGGLSNDKDVFIANYDRDGVFQWVAEMGNQNLDDDVYRVITNEIGNPYVLGYIKGDGRFYDGYRLDPITITNNQNKDLFLAEYSQEGLLNWVSNVLCEGNDEAKGIALDKNYSIFLTGNYDGSDLTIGDDVLAGPPNNSGFFITKAADAIQTGTQLFANTGVQNYRVCAGTVDVAQFVPQGTFTAEANNVYTVELSDPNGNFNTTGAKVIGTLASAASPVNIPIEIPEDQVYGVKYRVRVKSSAPALTALDNGTDITIDPKPFAGITGQNEFCAGGSVVLTAVNTNQNSPLAVPGNITNYDYQWKLNGVNVGANSNTIVADDASVGDYTVTLTRKTPNASNSLACSDVSDVFTVVSNPLPTPVVTTSKVVSSGSGSAADPKIIYACPGEFVDFKVNSYPTILWANNQTSDSISVSNPIDYYVDVTDAKGCQNRSDYFRIVNINIPTTITAGGNTTICEGQNVVLTAPALASLQNVTAAYQWKRDGVNVNGAVSPSYTVNALDTLDQNRTFNYTVVITQGSCTKETDPVSVTLVDTDIALAFNDGESDITQPQFFCEATTFTLTAEAGYTSYQWWKDGSPISGANSATFSGTQGGTYALQYETSPNICGMIVSPSIQVIANPIPVALISSTGVAAVNGVKTICAEGNTVLAAQPTGSGYSYSWSNNGNIVGTGASITVDAAAVGVYTLVVTNTATGCSSLPSDALTVVALPTPMPSVKLSANGGEIMPTAGSGSLADPFVVRLCPGTELTLEASSGYSAYNWTDALTTQTIVRSNAGVYFVNVDTTVNGVVCSGVSYYYSLEYPVAPIAEILASSSTGSAISDAVINICAGDSVKLSAFVPSGSTYTFSWVSIKGGVETVVSNNQTIWASSTNDYRVDVQRVGDLCVVQSPVVSVIVLVKAGEAFAVEVSGSDTICAGDASLSLDAGPGYNLYQWYAREITNGGSTDWQPISGATTQFLSPSNVPSGVYDFKVVVSSAFCGANVESSPVRVNINLLPSAPSVLVTPNVPAPLVPDFVTIQVLDSVAGFKYIYSLDGVEQAISDFATYTTSKGGNWSVTVVNENGCTASSDVSVITDVAEVKNINGLEIYPNPTNAMVSVDLNLTVTADVRIDVLNALGQKVFETSAKSQVGANTHAIDFSNFASGVYTVRVATGKEVVTKKVVRN